MAKELPYFQFEPAEYLSKDISFCSLPAQGYFINICSYYWLRNCILTKNQLLKRLNHETELNELIDEGVIDLDGENIKIKFLDIQLGNVLKTSKVNSKNGSKGGRPKNPIKTQTKAKLNPNESETKGIREDKIKEEYINNVYNRFVDEVKSGGFDSRIESMYIRLKIKHGSLTPLLIDFKHHLIEEDREHKTTNELFLNFKNWLNVQDRIKKLDKYR